MRRGLYRRSRQGGRSQRTLLHSPFTSVSDPRGLADPYGLGRVYGVPDFLWVAGDGNAPTIGPGLVQIGGAPTVGASPWQLVDGTDVASERYSGFSRRSYNTLPFDPGIGEDSVIAVVGKLSPFGGAFRYFTGTGVAGGQGFYLAKLSNQGGLLLGLRTSAGLISTSDTSAHNPNGSIFVALCIHNLTLGQLRIWTPSGVSSVATVGGTITGGGVGVACSPGGGSQLSDGSELQMVAYSYAPGIATAWEADTYARCEDFANRFTGLHPTVGDTPAFARNSAASWEDHNGIWHIASPDLPRAGDADGLRAAPTRTNKCYNTINPQVTTGWATTGGTHTVPSDAAQLLTDGAQNWGPNVHQFAPGGSDEVVYGGDVSANTNAHSSSAFMKGEVGGESVDFVGRDVSAGTVVNLGTVVLTTSWVRYIVDGWTPADTDVQFGLDCDAGDTVLFIAPQMEEGATATTPIPNPSTVAAAVRPAEVVTTGYTPVDAQGSLEAKLTPMNYDAADIVGSPVVLDRAGGATLVMHANAAGWRAGDGTNTATSGTPTDGDEDLVRSRWGGGLSIDSDGVRDTTSYDGALTGSGALTVEPGEETQVKDLKAYRNGS